MWQQNSLYFWFCFSSQTLSEICHCSAFASIHQYIYKSKQLHFSEDLPSPVLQNVSINHILPHPMVHGAVGQDGLDQGENKEETRNHHVWLIVDNWWFLGCWRSFLYYDAVNPILKSPKYFPVFAHVMSHNISHTITINMLHFW